MNLNLHPTALPVRRAHPIARTKSTVQNNCNLTNLSCVLGLCERGGRGGGDGLQEAGGGQAYGVQEVRQIRQEATSRHRGRF